MCFLGLRPQAGTTSGLIQLVQKQLNDKQDIIDKQERILEERNQVRKKMYSLCN